MSILRNLLKSIWHFYLKCRDYIFCRIALGCYKSSWRFWGIPIISKCNGSTIDIGNNFVACSLAKYNSIGVIQKVIIKTTHGDSKLVIGNNVGISGCTISCSKHIFIGNSVYIGSGVLITDSDAHSVHPDLRKESQFARRRAVVIEDDVFVGARSIVLKGVTIGQGSVIGAGSVVTSNIPRMCVAAGNPAKVISAISDVGMYVDIS